MIQSFDQIVKSIEQLPATEQERIRQWPEDKGASNGEEHNSQVPTSRSVTSLKWLDENRERFSGQWVALDGDRLMITIEVSVFAQRQPFISLRTTSSQGAFWEEWAGEIASGYF